jgi:hypothetical protein
VLLCRYEWLWLNFAPAPAAARSSAAAPCMWPRTRPPGLPLSSTPRRLRSAIRR